MKEECFYYIKFNDLILLFAPYVVVVVGGVTGLKSVPRMA